MDYLAHRPDDRHTVHQVDYPLPYPTEAAKKIFATFFGRILIFYAFCALFRKFFDFKKYF